MTNEEVYQIGESPMMLLIDVGNTQTVIGVTDNSSKIGEYVAKWRISTNKSATSDDILSILAPLFDNSRIALDDVERAAICSVVPRLESSWSDCVRGRTGVETVKCTASAAVDAGLLGFDYPNPEEIGADRVADAIAAKHLHGSPVVVVDFGTATNMEVIDERGIFIGGIIAPGIMTSSEALFSNASKIQPTSFAVPERPIGRSTQEAVGSGVILGQVSMVDGLLARVFDQLGRKARTIGTGGLVGTVGSLCENITEICPDLTIDGLRILLDHIR